jgi:hypothetical protein
MVEKINHINERGSHTTVIEQAQDVIKLLKKSKIEVSPGKIEVINAKSRSVKFNFMNKDLSEMTVTSGRSKQTFKVFADADFLYNLFSKNKDFKSWNINSSR